MSGELAVSFVLKLQDQASGAAMRVSDVMVKAIARTTQAVKGNSDTAISAYQKMANAREVLGVRAEKAIQNEIRQTEAAYKRLETSGTQSARELARAHEAMRAKVAELNREMGKSQITAGGMARGVAAGLAGYQAAKFVVADPIRQTMSYDRQLAHLANTAYAGQSMDTRRAGMRTLDAAVTSAVRVGGGTREGAMATLDKLVASGAYTDVREAAGLLPVLTKAGTAANADPTQLADIAIRAKQTFGLTNTGLALDQAIKAGQMGGFELKDMAKWLPQQMAMARQSGLKGDEGFRTLLAANQAVAITAGTKDEAGNNLVNLLAKINSQDTANDAKKLGINLSGSLAAARAKGVNSLDAFVNLVDQIVGKDQRYAALKEKAKTAKGDEQKAAYESMGDILQGSSIGKIIQDRQALMALVGIMNNRDYISNIRGESGKAGGTAQDAFGLIAETPSFKAEQLAAEKAISLQAALDKVNPTLGQLAENMVNHYREYPVFSAAVTLATTALGALAAAAAAAGLSTMVMGGGKGGIMGTLGRGAGAVGKAALGVAGAIFSPTAVGMAAAGATGYALGDMVVNPLINKGASLASGRKDETLGGLLYELLHREKQPTKVEVDVHVQDGNIVASVNDRNAREARRH